MPAPDLGIWTGLYIGAGVSATKTKLGFPGGSGSTRITDTTAPGVSDYFQPYPLNKNLFSDGTFIDFGARFQINRFVVGADFDLDFGAKKILPATQGQLDGLAGVFTTGNYVSLGLNSFGGFQSLGHLRGVLGYSITPKILLFGSAGVAKAKFYETGVSASGAIASSPAAPLVGAATSSRVPGEKYGRSLGIGMDVKTSDNVIARIEYINDHYSFPLAANAGFGGTLGEVTVNSNIATGGKVTYDINTIRASLNYRLGPSDTSPEITKLTSQDSYGKWGGFYVGFGETYTSNKTETNGVDNLTISGPLGLVLSRTGHPTRIGDNNYEHLLAGYLHQFSNSRFVVGAEYSHDFNNEFDYHLPSVSGFTVSGVNFISNPGAAQCGTYTPGAFTCVGGTFNGAVKVTDHFRAIAGFEVLPSLLVFGSAGVVRAKIEFDSVTASGFVASPPSSPLVGKATVTNMQGKTVWGRSIGGGAQYKIMDHVALRVEYLRDSAKIAISGGGAGFGGTIGNQTTNYFISPGTKESFVNESWRASLIYQF